MGRLKLHWASQYRDLVSNQLGYSVHNSTMLEYVSRRKDVELAEDAEDALTITSADIFKSGVPGKINWLFTMFEGTKIPDAYKENVHRADRLLVPCRFCRDLFGQHYNGKIYICPEGAEPKIFQYKKRNFSYPFRYLWIGAPNPRKGYEETIAAWIGGGFINDPHVELYLKTTKVRPVDEATNPKMAARFKRIPDYEKKGNIIFDSRKLPLEELVALYHSAHVLVHPTRGEGWGLILCEAMSTGLPCIATPWSGTADFFDKTVGLPLEYTVKDTEVRLWLPESEGVEDFVTGAAFPHVQHLVDSMDYCYRHYGKVKQLGKAASKRIHSQFTWEQAAEKLIDIIRRDKDGRR